MNAEALVSQAIETVRGALPPDVSPEYLDHFCDRKRADILHLAQEVLPSIRGTRGAARLFWDGTHHCIQRGYLTTRGFEVVGSPRPYKSYEGAKKAAWTWAGRPPKLKDLKVDDPVKVLSPDGQTVGRGRIFETSPWTIGVEWPDAGRYHRAWFHPGGKETTGDRRIQP